MSKEELTYLIIELKEEISFLKKKIERIEKRNYKHDLERRCIGD